MAAVITKVVKHDFPVESVTVDFIGSNGMDAQKTFRRVTAADAKELAGEYEPEVALGDIIETDGETDGDIVKLWSDEGADAVRKALNVLFGQ